MLERVYSSNDENYQCDSINEAVQELLECNDIQVGSVVTVYEGKPFGWKASSFFSVNTLLNEMQDTASNTCGEFAHEYLDDVSVPDMSDLDERISSLIDEWAKENNYQPNFYLVEDIHKITVKVTSEEGDWEFV